MDYARPGLLAEPEWLAAHLNDSNLRIIDCAPLAAYNRAHIPGAVGLPTHVYIKDVAPPGADHGTFVMPPAPFEQLMGDLGVDNNSLVVVYDDDNARLATRLWWVLKYYGHTSAKVLNGGWQRWLSEGRPVTFHPAAPARTAFRAVANPDVIADAAYLVDHHQDPSCQVLDARTDGEWEGTVDRGNRRVGRVPGSHHLEWVNLVEHSDTPRFLPADELSRLLTGAGLVPGKATITYCQGGIRAAHAAFALELLGWDNVRVYDGSMRDWANRDDTPLTLS